MKKIVTLIFIMSLAKSVFTQSIYFPPLVGKNWDTLSAQNLAWCTQYIDTLYQFLGSTQSKSFMVLVDGKIVLEKYFGNFTQDSAWYWASAGKTLTSMVVGIAQEQGFLNIQDTSSKYLGLGWTSLPKAKEDQIKIWHQLTMTSGLDDGPLVNDDCTTDSCLKYKADAGTRWAYHNAPYTLLDKVVSNATGQTYQQFFNANIRNKTGMSGLWVKVDYNNVFFSNTRSMARFGLLLLNRGKWDQTTVLADTNYLNQMLSPSQNLNKGYGYLTWLNGSSDFMLPGTQIVFKGMLTPNAPADMFAAMGKNGQLLMVVPSQKLVLIRMGEDPADNSLVPVTYANKIWEQFSKVLCKGSIGMDESSHELEINIFPNPSSGLVKIEGIASLGFGLIQIFDTQGRLVQTENAKEYFDVSALPEGVYSVLMEVQGRKVWKRIVKSKEYD
jgi:CubicO group peptidase (beta-lactamase class C family)